MEADRGDRVGAGRDAGREASGTGTAQPRRNQRISYQRTDPHHTRLPPTLLLARALRWGKYPMSKIFWVLVNGDKGLSRYYAMERYLSVE
jgi:hypothetical protein